VSDCPKVFKRYASLCQGVGEANETKACQVMRDAEASLGMTASAR
jgi:hypothetical protein